MSSSRGGDVLRTFDRLGIAPDDHQLRDRLARLLGMEWLPARYSASPSSTALAIPPTAPPASAHRPSKPPQSGRTPLPPVDPPADPIPEPFGLTRVASPERRFPAWMNDAPALRPADPTTASTPPASPPLLDPVQARSVLSSALARRMPDGPIDIETVLARISRAEAVLTIPRATVPSIARGVQLVIDRGDGLAPYATDVIWIREALRRVVGSYALEVLQFAHAPLRGAGKGSRRTWQPYADLTPPRPGATIVAVTDLGIRNLEPPAQPATVDEWVAFADHLDRLGCPLLALVPYARTRVPRALRRRFAILEWDRRTTAGRVRALLARGLP